MARSARESEGTARLDAVFAALKGRLMRHTRRLAVLTDRPGRYEVTGETTFTVTSLRTGREITKKNGYFAGIIVQRDYVGFYFMPPYSESGFMDEFSAEMRKRLKGKSCFHFRRPEEVDAELDRLIAKGYRVFAAKGLV